MVIANRILNFSGENGKIQIPIRIFAPERNGADGNAALNSLGPVLRARRML